MMGFNCFQDFDDSSYGLRENPKKTWRVSVLDREQSMEDSENRGLIKCNLKRDMEEDMSYHSGKKSRVSILSENTRVGFEVLCPVKKKRSKLRYKVSGFCSVSDFGLVSKFSKFSGEEEAAMSLVMLSSGFTNWYDFVSDFGSAENDSLISKAKALNRKEIELIFESEPTGVKLGNKRVLGCARADSELIMSGETRVCDQDTELGAKVSSCESKFGDFCPRNAFVNLWKGNDFQIKKFSFGEHNAELGVRLTSCDSEHGNFVMRNAFEKPMKGDNFEIAPLDSKSGKTNFEDFVPINAFENLSKGNDFQIKKISFGEHDTELGVKLTSCDSEHGDFVMRNAFEKPMKGDSFEIDPLDSESGKTNNFRASEETSFDDQNTELGTNGFVGIEIDDSGSKISEYCEKEPEFKCKTCNKKFLSFQALGGHHSKKCHDKSYKMEICYEQKKNKCIHECPTCFKVFPSGQSLGGHKRAHFVGFSEYKMKQSAAAVTGFSVEEQLGSGFRLRPCGAESDRGPEPVLISIEENFQV